MFKLLWNFFTLMIVVCILSIGISILSIDYPGIRKGNQDLLPAISYLKNNVKVAFDNKVIASVSKEPRLASIHMSTGVITINVTLLELAKNSPYPNTLIPAVILHELGHAKDRKNVNRMIRKLEVGLISKEIFTLKTQVIADAYAISVMPVSACALEYFLVIDTKTVAIEDATKKRMEKLHQECEKHKKRAQAIWPAYFNTQKSDFCVFFVIKSAGRD